MFTGIVETIAAVTAEKNEEITRFTIEKPTGWELTVGQSIAVNGTCLTVVSFDERGFAVELVAETLTKTSFGSNPPKKVNLERAMLAGGRFEGHIVQGHIDTVGTAIVTATKENNWTLTVSFDQQFDYLVVPKGSITIDGVSLTVVDPRSRELSVALIPHTLENTTLGALKEGSQVNLEFDIVGKYLQKLS